MHIADIKIGARHRKDLGDLGGLAESIKAEGLLQPIGVTPDNQLVFGLRRLTACRDHLGLAEIDARVVNVTSIVNGEYAENEMRKDFTVSERVAILETIGKRPVGRPKNNSLNLPNIPAADQAAKLAGFGSLSIAAQARTVIDRGAPELITAMDKGEIAISEAAKIAKKPKDEQRQIVATPRKQRKETKTAAPRANNTELVAKTLRAKTGQWPTASKLAREAGVSPRAADNALRTVKAVEQARAQAFDGEIMVSIHVLIEKLVPLFERVREQSKRHVGLISTGELLLIASEGRRLLDSWASGDETVRRARGHVVPPTRPTHVEKGVS